MAVFVIAEIGINHNGDMSICKELIDVAVEAGCDAVKFQKRTIDKVYTQEFLDSYRESPWGITQRDQKIGQITQPGPRALYQEEQLRNPEDLGRQVEKGRGFAP